VLKSFSAKEKWAFAAILTAGAALRIWAALTTGPVHPDEIFQYLEQAHRTAFGSGIVTWEYRYGMRSWLLPLALSVPMRLGEAIAPGTQLYLLLPNLCVAAVSLLVLPAAYALGARLSRFHGFVAMAVAATWYDIFFFGSHVLTEPLSAALILAASALLLRDASSRKGLVAAGLLFGIASILRFHYLPAVGVMVLLACGAEWRRRWLPLALGGAGAAAIGAAVDLAMGQGPYSWIFSNFAQNVVADRASNYGVSPPLAYAQMLAFAWGAALLPLLLLPIAVIRQYRPLLAAAAVNLLVHSLIGHKEYRFIFLSVAILVIVAAIGSAELLLRARPRLSVRRARIAAAALAALWLGTSAALAHRGALERSWTAGVAGAQASEALAKAPELCGVALFGLDLWTAGGYAHLHRNVPLYVVEPPFDAGAEPPIESVTPAFNGILAPETRRASVPNGYRLLGCSDPRTGVDPAQMLATVRVCAYLREGGCNAQASGGREIQAVMKRIDW
jgi:hypothetical protein